jgi:hypothetical protein
MTAHDQVGVDRCKDRKKFFFRSQASEDRPVTLRSCMTEKNLTDSVDLHRNRWWPRFENSLLYFIETVSVPLDERPRLLGYRRRIPAQHHVDHGSIAISSNELGWNVETQEQIEALRRERSRKYISANHYPVNLRAPDVCDHRLERRQVPMYVVKARNSHELTACDIFSR